VNDINFVPFITKFQQAHSPEMQHFWHLCGRYLFQILARIATFLTDDYVVFLNPSMQSPGQQVQTNSIHIIMPSFDTAWRYLLTNIQTSCRTLSRLRVIQISLWDTYEYQLVSVIMTYSVARPNMTWKKDQEYATASSS
jgi:hypothetical protein